jgi:hypothetical protein
MLGHEMRHEISAIRHLVSERSAMWRQVFRRLARFDSGFLRLRFVPVLASLIWHSLSRFTSRAIGG